MVVPLVIGCTEILLVAQWQVLIGKLDTLNNIKDVMVLLKI